MPLEVERKSRGWIVKGNKGGRAPWGLIRIIHNTEEGMSAPATQAQ